MKRKLILTTIVAAGLASVSVAFLALANASPEPVPEEAESVTLEVRGMRSLMCEIGVRSALKGIEGVEAVTVNREAAEVRVSFDPALASPLSFVQAVQAVGFRAALPEGYELATAPEAPQPAAHAGTTSRLTADEIERVAGFVARRIVETEEIPGAAAIEEATGVELSIGDTPVLQQAVLERLADDPRGRELLAGSRCSDYGACSLWGNLAGAGGETLALYEREKALDGTTYDDRPLPSFEARDLEGRTVHSDDLRGRPAVVALLAVHCNHSMETFPVLQELHRRYSEDGLQVVGVLVNSGTFEDAAAWVPHFAPEYPVWVAQGDSLGDLVGSHLVPTYLLVDANGKVRKLLVGFHDRESVVAELHPITNPVSRPGGRRAEKGGDR